MIYTVNNIEKFQKVELHDYELVSINVDYIGKRLRVFCKNPKGLEVSIHVDKFYYLLVQGFEPWGEGFYIYSHQILKELDLEKLENIDSSIFGVEILINSGDKVIIYMNKIIIE